MNPAPGSGSPDHLVETVTFQAAGIDEMERRLEEFNKLIDDTVDGADEIGEVLKAAAASFVAPHRKSKSSNTPPVVGGAQYGPGTPRSTLARTMPSKLSEKKFAEAGVRLKEAQQEAPSKLVQSGIRSIEEQDKALLNAFTELDKLRRDLNDGTFRKVASEMDKYRKITAEVTRQQAKLNVEAKKQELQARYGEKLGMIEHRRRQLEENPGLKTMLQRMGQLNGYLYHHAQAGLSGSVYDEQLRAQQGRLDRELGATQIGPTQIKTKLTGIAADHLQKLTPAQQDAVGWGMWAGQHAPEGTGKAVAAAGLAALPAVGAGALRFGLGAARAVAPIATGAGGGVAGVLALAASPFMAKYNRMDAERHIAKRERGDTSGMEEESPFGDKEFRTAMMSDDPRVREKALNDMRMKEAKKHRDQMSKRGGAIGNYIGSVFGYTTEEDKDFADKDAKIRKQLERVRGGKDADDVKAAKAADANIKAGLAPGHKYLPHAAGGFESSDDTYQRIEAAFSKQMGDQANKNNDQGMEGLTKAINGLVEYLQKIFGGEANKEQNKMLKGR